jgi:hypothetical protein
MGMRPTRTVSVVPGSSLWRTIGDRELNRKLSWGYGRPSTIARGPSLNRESRIAMGSWLV